MSKERLEIGGPGWENVSVAAVRISLSAKRLWDLLWHEHKTQIAKL